jgi:hypothetical protein
VGYVWDDNDGATTGMFETGTEGGIEGVTVFLCSTSPCGDGNAIATTTTDANGFYSFGNLTPGSYYVSVSPPAGMEQSGDPDFPNVDCDPGNCDNQTTSAVSVAVNEITGPINFGYDGGLNIGDTVYADWNGDGTQDVTAEEGIAGVTVLLYHDLDGDGAVDFTDVILDTQITDLNGNYLFSNVSPNGDYLVVVSETSLPVGYVQTGDPDEVGTCTVCDADYSLLNLAASDLDGDFGYQPRGLGSIGDFVWFDTDGDGVQDAGEPGISGVIVNLYEDANGDGLIDPATDALIGTTTTDGSGNYVFSSLADGNYIVEVDQSNFSTGNALDSETLSSAGAAYTNTSGQVSYRYTLTGGTDFLDADFGFVSSAIGDTIWLDENGDGAQGSTEPGISGVDVFLCLVSPCTSGNAIATTTTNADGEYWFEGLTPGTYYVAVDTADLPAGSILTADPDSNLVDVPCPAGSGSGSCDDEAMVELLLGQTINFIDFGYRSLAAIGDTVFIDVDNDGIHDPVEPGIAGVTVWLCTTNPCASGNAVQTTTTDADGLYFFDGLADDTYYVVVNPADIPLGLLNTVDPDGDLDGDSGAVVIASSAVTSIGGTACTACDLDVDFGYRYNTDNQVNGTVWNDTNEDQNIDPGETGRYGNVPVYLVDCGTGTCDDGDESLYGLTTTDGSGFYSFTDLPNGTYQVVVNPAAPSLFGTTATTPTSSGSLVLTGASTETVNFGFNTNLDLGDLPTSYNNTRMANNGARHAIGNVYLGSAIDADGDGQENATATGDDADGIDDEDGVARSSIWTDGANGATIDVAVVCPSGTCYLNAWVDWNEDGSFGAGEQVFSDLAVSNGPNLLTFDVPAGTFVGSGPNVVLNARFRLYAGPTGGLAQPTGYSGNGEVEDYQWIFTPTAITLKNISATTQTSTLLVMLAGVLLLAGGGYVLLRFLPQRISSDQD